MAGRIDPDKNLTVIHAGQLLSVPGQPPKAKQSIFVVGGVITGIEDGFSKRGTRIDLSDQYVMPGLIDMHTHVTGVLNLSEPASKQIGYKIIGRPAEAVLDTLPRVRELLMGGFTTIRSVGDPTSTTYALRDAVEGGQLPSPRIFVCESQICVDGGDFDACCWCVRHDLENHVENRGNYSGAEEARRVVRKEINRGADFIKFRQAGAPAGNPNIKMVETVEEIRAVIDTAHQLDRRVAVHVNGTPTFLHEAIKAGVDTVEHGPLDDEAIALMKQHGTAYTPTLLAAKMVDYRYQDAAEGMVKAYRAGVRVIFGSDLGIFGPDQLHEEFALMTGAGIPPEEVLKAATLNAAAALGRIGANLGSILPGKSADIIAISGDPHTNLGRLGVPDEISFVMKSGKIFKHKGWAAD